MANQQRASMSQSFQEDIETAVLILKAAGCTEIYEFGSRASDAYRAGSDLDLAVRGCPRAAFYHLWGSLMVALEHIVVLVDLDSQDPLALQLGQSGALRRVG